MAGQRKYTVLIDASVLYSVAMSDAMMEVSLTGIYAAKWSQRLDDEWTKNLAANHRRPVSDFYTRRDLMHKVCPDWEVPEQAWRLIEPSIQLPDPKDKQVLAALERNGLLQRAAILRQALQLI